MTAYCYIWNHFAPLIQKRKGCEREKGNEQEKEKGKERGELAVGPIAMWTGGGTLLPKLQHLMSFKDTHYSYISASGLRPLLQKGTLASFLPPLFDYPEHPVPWGHTCIQRHHDPTLY